MTNKFQNMTFDQERALYGLSDAEVIDCTFDGPADGESALKESRDLHIVNSDFRLRYPFWHVRHALIENSRMAETCRAPFWYNEDITLKHCQIDGVKAIREVNNASIENSRIRSAEFGWMSNGLTLKNTELESEYPFMNSSNLTLSHVDFKGKYSFQYVNGMKIDHSVLDTKDAFWHCKNVTVTDSVIKGEYLGWYSENLKLIRCKIIGSQPLCYAKNLLLEDCDMIGCDLAFENSDVNAIIKGSITSIKNPKSGRIEADLIQEIIMNNDRPAGNSCRTEIIERSRS